MGWNTLCDKARERSKRQTDRHSKRLSKARKNLRCCLVAASQCQSRACVTVWSTMFPAIVALVVFECLEWTESLVTARLSWTTRTLLEPILLDRRATGVRGHRYALVSLQFPGLFNIVRLWRLTAGYLKEILEDLGRRPEHEAKVEDIPLQLLQLFCWETEPEHSST